MANYKTYLLDDGTITTSNEVVERTGISLGSARVRLSTSSDPNKVFRKKKKVNYECMTTYQMKAIKKRGMYDTKFVKCMKSI